jgi:hypothetical protein
MGNPARKKPEKLFGERISQRKHPLLRRDKTLPNLGYPELSERRRGPV